MSKNIILSKTSFLLISMLLMVCLSFSVSAADWFDNDWGYRKEITLLSSQVEENINNFPVLIDISDSDLGSKAQSDGDDILFTGADGLTKLDHEIEYYSSGQLIAWVETDVSASSDTIIYMYYGNNGASNQESVSGVWQNFVFVHHLEDVEDSTSNNNDGTNNGGTSVNAKIGDGYDFGGDGDDIEISSSVSIETAVADDGMTVSLWVRHDDLAQSNQAQFSFFEDWSNRQYIRRTSGPIRAYQTIGGSGSGDTTSGSHLDGEWHLLTWVIDGTNNEIYVDGDYKETLTLSNPITSISGADVYLSTVEGSFSPYDGAMDEVRLSSQIRSAGYIETEYNNQNGFIALGAEEVVGNESGVLAILESKEKKIEEEMILPVMEEEVPEEEPVNETEETLPEEEPVEETIETEDETTEEESVEVPEEETSEEEVAEDTTEEENKEVDKVLFEEETTETI